MPLVPEKEENVSQAVLAILINDHVEQISCVPDIVNPHSVYSLFGQ